ncbi:MAG: M48 family metallopeptidase [Ignavibacteriaceae bacterium]|nr:M48 family metallopeptidase [Ignavibacteriaceae bacterium]
MDAKRYNNVKLAVGIAKGIASFILILLFVLSGLSITLQHFLQGYLSNNYLLFLAFVIITGAAAGIIFFPVNYYTEFYLEHKYDLSNQTFIKWIWEDVKTMLVSGVIGIPVLLIFFYSMNKFNLLWWLPFAIILFVISVILARIVPVFILPLFYKIVPIDNEDLKNRIQALAKDAGIKVENVYKFDMSKNTKKANAAFTGIGKSKRILLGDTLLESYTTDEIETVIAHELGHYKRKHIIKNIFIGTASSFLTLFLIAYLYNLSLSWFGFTTIVQISAIPLLSLWAMIISLILNPLSNMISRKFEYQADEYAIISTNKKEAFISTLEKLTDQNLGDREPHPLVEWFFYSHPSIKNRVAAIRNFSIGGMEKSNNLNNNLNLQDS